MKIYEWDEVLDSDSGEPDPDPPRWAIIELAGTGECVLIAAGGGGTATAQVCQDREAAGEAMRAGIAETASVTGPPEGW